MTTFARDEIINAIRQICAERVDRMEAARTAYEDEKARNFPKCNERRLAEIFAAAATEALYAQTQFASAMRGEFTLHTPSA